MKTFKTRLAIGSGAAVLACAVVGGYEGLWTKSYRDIVGVPTACYGETRGIKMGMEFTKAECDAMLVKGLQDFEQEVYACAPSLQSASAPRLVAHVSLAYNIGSGAYCRSSIARLEREGKHAAACDAFLLYNKAGGRTVKGLVRRREAERKLCLQDA